ncbi:uncharacterized protein LOC117340389 [Pecten maximus]|uniref:uncharacterized protein LOC117340389 n=1 Tax=Pecten maximus TaxID=6579 RepID=UPI001457F573|nr:uncharacterized protein LOC117340389 [Pecten maximus]
MDSTPSDSENDLFVTPNEFKEDTCSSEIHTDSVIDSILNLESNQEQIPDFTLKRPIFSDISDEELIKAKKNTTSPKEQIRFVDPIQDEERYKLSKTRFAKKKTDAKSKWAVNLFNNLVDSRRTYADRQDIRHVQGDWLSMGPETLEYSLGAFIFEIRKENGDEYQGNTLYEIIVAIQHFLRENGKFVTMLDVAEFEGMQCKHDKKMKDLAAKGVGIDKQLSHVFFVDDEDKMWKCGVLSSDTQDKLRDTLLGLKFALRGGQEHHNLRQSENSQL